MRLLFAPFFLLGRILLWIVVFPLGLWRSLRHGAKKDKRKIIEEIKQARRD